MPKQAKAIRDGVINPQNYNFKHDLNFLFQVCVFVGRLVKQDGRPGLWLPETFSTSSLKPLNGIQRNLTGSKIYSSFTNFVFFRPIGKQDGRPDLWLAETFSTSSLKLPNGIQRILPRIFHFVILAFFAWPTAWISQCGDIHLAYSIIPCFSGRIVCIYRFTLALILL